MSKAIRNLPRREMGKLESIGFSARAHVNLKRKPRLFKPGKFIKTLGCQASKQKRILIFLSFLFLIAIGQQLYKLYFVFRQGNFVDFNVYWEATKFALAGGDFYQKLYLGTIPFNYPPTALLFFSFLLLFPKSIASLILLTASLASLLGSIFLLIRLQFSKSKRVVFFLLASIFFIQYFPTKFTLTLGQINLVTLFLITCSFYAFKKGKNIAGAIFLSLASLIKIFPAFLLLIFLKEKRKSVAFPFLITSILGVLLTTLFFKPFLISDYLCHIGKNLFLQAGGTSYFDQSLNSFLLRLNLGVSLRLLFRIISSLFLIVLFLKTKDEAISFFGLIAAVTIVLPSFVWLHHYVILIPIMILLFFKIYREPSPLPKIALFLGYIACSFHFRNPETPVLKNIFLASHPLFGAAITLFLAQYYGQFEKQL